MNRDYKFRAWDLHRKEMNYKVLVGNTDHNDKNYTCNSLLCVKGRIVEWRDADEFDIKLMQFIGLKDKNGNEIYEGDILKYPHRGYKRTFLIEYGRLYNEIGKVVCNGFIVDDDYDNMIVIGNIYENPELLEGKK